jgi:hypothetical protein
VISVESTQSAFLLFLDAPPAYRKPDICLERCRRSYLGFERLAERERSRRRRGFPACLQLTVKDREYLKRVFCCAAVSRPLHVPVNKSLMIPLCFSDFPHLVAGHTVWPSGSRITRDSVLFRLVKILFFTAVHRCDSSSESLLARNTAAMTL